MMKVYTDMWTLLKMGNLFSKNRGVLQIAILAIFFVINVVFHPVFFKLWWLYDDPMFIYLSLKYNPLSFLINKEMYAMISVANYTPFIHIPYYINVKFFGINSLPMYIYQLILLTVLNFVMFQVLVLLEVDKIIAFLSAVLFSCLGPVITVGYLCMVHHYIESLILALIAFAFLMRANTKKEVLFSACFYLLACLCKEISVMLFVFFIVYIICSKKNFNTNKKVFAIMFYVFSFVLYVVVRIYFIGLGGYNRDFLNSFLLNINVLKEFPFLLVNRLFPSINGYFSWAVLFFLVFIFVYLLKDFLVDGLILMAVSIIPIIPVLSCVGKSNFVGDRLLVHLCVLLSFSLGCFFFRVMIEFGIRRFCVLVVYLIILIIFCVLNFYYVVEISDKLLVSSRKIRTVFELECPDNVVISLLNHDASLNFSYVNEIKKLLKNERICKVLLVPYNFKSDYDLYKYICFSNDGLQLWDCSQKVLSNIRKFRMFRRRKLINSVSIILKDGMYFLEIYPEMINVKNYVLVGIRSDMYTTVLPVPNPFQGKLFMSDVDFYIRIMRKSKEGIDYSSECKLSFNRNVKLKLSREVASE